MKLLTKEVENKLPALYSTEDVPLDEKIAVVKFFNPVGSWSWYATEGSWEEYDDGSKDFLFFGLVYGNEREWGYFSLNELQSVKLPFGLGIERDRYFDSIPIKEL